MTDRIKNYALKTFAFIIVTEAALLISYPGCRVAAGGLGEQLMRSDDTTGAAGDKPLLKDSLFGGPIQPNPPDSESDFSEKISKVHIDVVCPSKDLRDVMNTISTRAQYLLLTEGDRYFDNMSYDSSSRPMLLTFLKVDAIEKEKLLEWYRPIRERKQERVAESCRDLAEKRQEAVQSAGGIEDAIADCQRMLSRYRCVYLVAWHNQILFMMDLYLKLCLKLESNALADQFKYIKLST